MDDFFLHQEARGPAVAPVPQQRIKEKVDACMARQDYAGVERTLRYWLAEAECGGDHRGKLMILNELVGHYRKTGEQEKMQESADAALELIRRLDYAGSISAATTYVNIATAYNSVGMDEQALSLFEQAKAIYESSPGADLSLLGGLYNNMGLVCAALRRYDQALKLFDQALAAMGQVKNGALEQAVTYLNMANAIEGKLGLEEAEGQINAWLDRAAELLNDETLPRDGYYAYVCQHCAPVFSYYGYFLAADDLKNRAERIYERA